MNKTILTFALLFAVLAAPLALAYPTVTIITESNTYGASNYGMSAPRTIVPNNPYPYVSGPEYAYWPNTMDYVDGYRDGYNWGRNDDRYDCDRYSSSRNRDCRTYYGRDCDDFRGSRYDDCRDHNRVRYSTSYTAWNNNRYITYPHNTYTHYSYVTYPVHYPRYW